MIICPICKNWNDIISEPPSWIHTDNPKDELIEIQSHCCNCRIDFRTSHRLNNPVQIYDIETEKEYPFSA